MIVTNPNDVPMFYIPAVLLHVTVMWNSAADKYYQYFPRAGVLGQPGLSYFCNVKSD